MPVQPFPVPYPPPVIGQAVFSFAEFIALWPEFTGINPTIASNQFTASTTLLNNGPCSAVQDANIRLNLLYLLTAHLTFLNAGTNDGAGNVTPPPGIVGRIDSATEGSVSVGASYSSAVSESEAFFIQTKYGAQYWQQTTGYRMGGLYTPPPAFGPNGPGYPWPGGFFGEIE